MISTSTPLTDLLNYPPVASFIATLHGLLATITDNSTDPNSGGALGDSYNYTWTFGDNSTTTAHATVVGNNQTHTYTSLGNYIINLILTDAFGLSSATSTSVNITALNIANVPAIGDINVGFGTTLNNVGLPATAVVAFADGSTTTVPVIWNGGTPAYNGNVNRAYTFVGTLAASTGITNSGNLTASVKVNVAAQSGGGGGGGGGASYKTGDINKDGKVDEYDFSIMMSQWGETGSDMTADLNNDKIVDEYDLAILMANWD